MHKNYEEKTIEYQILLNAKEMPILRKYPDLKLFILTANNQNKF